MNAPGFLKRGRQQVQHHHPADLDAASTVQMFAGRLKAERTEAQAVGDQAEQAVIRATQLTKEIMAMVDKAKACAVDIEREGLAFIARVQKQQEDFNRRTENFVRSATELHSGLHDVLAKVAEEKKPEQVDADPEQAASIEEGLAEIVELKAGERK